MVPAGCSLIVDASSCQGVIDWDAAIVPGGMEAALAAAITKVSEGNADVADAQFVRNAREIARVSLPRGFYHFDHPDAVHARDAQDEAERCVRQIDRVGGFRPGLDFVAQDTEDRTLLVGEAYVRWLVDWADRMEELTGARSGVYVGGPYWAEHAGKTVSPELLQRVGERWLWSAAYVSSLDTYIAAPWTVWALRQQSGDVAPPGQTVLRVPTIGGGHSKVDRDLFRGTRDGFAAWVRSLVLVTTPEPATPDAHTYQHGGGTITDEIHGLPQPVDEPPDTEPQVPVAIRKSSSQRMPAVDAPIIDDTGPVTPKGNPD